MRVIAGEHKGRQLKTVPGKQTRPTSDKIKESVFQMIGPYFEGGLCLDLFAGSGSLGIEALSRGMGKAIFIEKSAKAFKVIHENINKLKLNEQSEVYRTDAIRALQVLSKRNLSFDLILLDPPYGILNDMEMISFIIDHNLISDKGIIYYEHAASDRVQINHADLVIVKQTNYGTTTGITILQYRK